MWITVEHFDRELDQKRLLGPTAEAAALLREVRKRHANVGMTVDLSHVEPTVCTTEAGERGDVPRSRTAMLAASSLSTKRSQPLGCKAWWRRPAPF